jgi:hypothetical protein
MVEIATTSALSGSPRTSVWLRFIVGKRREWLEAHALIHCAAVVPHREVVLFVTQRELHGRGLGWIDAHLLASAVVAGSRLWTLTKHKRCSRGEQH